MNDPLHPQNDPKLPKDIAARMQAIVDRHAQSYRDDVPALIAKMAAHAQAVSDPERWSEAMPLLKREAHDMKGQAATFGLPALSSVAQSLCAILDHASPQHADYAATITFHISTLSRLLTGDDPTLVEEVRLKGALLLEHPARRTISDRT